MTVKLTLGANGNNSHPLATKPEAPDRMVNNP
jgi:hypothetical protein